MLEYIQNTNDIVGTTGIDTSVETVVALEQRLHRGWELIDRAESQGKPTEDLFNHFLHLLGQYEHMIDARSLA